MQVLLLEKISGLGNIGDEVRVRPGYGRNYLIPQNKAMPASEENKSHIEKERAVLEKQQAAVRENYEARAVVLEKATITVTANCGPEGQLYGSIGANEICAAAELAELQLSRNELHLPEGRLTATGEHQVEARLGDMRVAVTVSVIPSTSTPD